MTTATAGADRLAIRELVDAYAFCADTRDAEGQKALFTDDTHFVVYMAGEGSDATYQDRFVRTDGTWRFAERRLYVRWTETRALEAAGVA
jgi:hypothetical protein